jgi:hypothetical protein
LPQWVLYVVPILSVFVILLLVILVFILNQANLNGKKVCENCKKRSSRYLRSTSRSPQLQNHLSSTNISDPTLSYNVNSEQVEQILLSPIPDVSRNDKDTFLSVISL